MAAHSHALVLKPDKHTVETYFLRQAEGRKVRLIQKEIVDVDTVIDLGCCNGLYAAALKSGTKRLIGV
ncbi:MAG TPA: hypothetical protein VIT68_02465 [Candidatus Gracilibacteria bacterium]